MPMVWDKSRHEQGKNIAHPLQHWLRRHKNQQNTYYNSRLANACAWNKYRVAQKKTSPVFLQSSCNYNNPAYAAVFNSKFHSPIWKKTYSITSSCNPCFRLSANGWFQKRVMLLHLLYQPHRLGFLLALLLTSLYTARTKATLLPKCSNIVFMNSVRSSRTTIAYLLVALKKVTELQLLWSIEAVYSITWYSKHLQSWIIRPFACDRCGPALKRK